MMNNDKIINMTLQRNEGIYETTLQRNIDGTIGVMKLNTGITPVHRDLSLTESIAEGFDYQASARGPKNVGGVEKAAQRRKQVIGEGSKFEERIKQEKELQAKRLSRNEEFRERERLRRIQQGIEAQQRRENDEWNPENTDARGLAANALKEWLIDEGEWEGETKEEFRSEIENIRNEMENDPEVIEDPNGDKAQEYGEDLTNLEEDMAFAESVYDIIPLYDYYGMYEFEYGGAEYAVGDDEAADEAATERTRSLIDDIGYEGFTPSFMEYYVNGDRVADYAEDWFWDDMSDSPEDYLDDDDRELTQHYKDEIEKINEEIGHLQEDLEAVSYTHLTLPTKA